MQQTPPPDAFVVTVVKEPAKEFTVADLIVGSFGIAGTLLLVAIVLGGVVGAVLVMWNKRHPADQRRLPPVSPSFTDAPLPPTSRSR